MVMASQQQRLALATESALATLVLACLHGGRGEAVWRSRPIEKYWSRASKAMTKPRLKQGCASIQLLKSAV